MILDKYTIKFERTPFTILGKKLRKPSVKKNTNEKKRVQAKNAGRGKRGPVFEKEEDYRAYVKSKLEEVYTKHRTKETKRSKAKKDRR